MFESVRYLLLQVRNTDDPMRDQEVICFARALAASEQQITSFDLLSGFPSLTYLDQFDVVLLGGSGDYSATDTAAWIEPILAGLFELAARRKPTFASCWGFQAMARALGGTVLNDLDRTEVGTFTVSLTDLGRDDPIFGPMGNHFPAQMGHEDSVITLPAEVVHLARSSRVENQAYRVQGAPVYCTQFHPELNRSALETRARRYRRYVEHVAGVSMEEFCASLQETPQTDALLTRFVEIVLGS